MVVKALHFNPRFLGELLARIEAGVKPETIVPRAIIFSEAEIDQANTAIMAVKIPDPLRRRIEHFASQFDSATLTNVAALNQH